MSRIGLLKNRLLAASRFETYFIFFLSLLMSAAASYYFYIHDWILAYGDSESHLNIAKRMISSLTPGVAQLGGIWLPLPHLMLVPFVSFDFLWRTGLAGTIVSGGSFVISSIFIYKIAYLVTKSRLAFFLVFIIFSLNPNILYLQSTAMTELPLIAAFVLSTYYFLKYVYNSGNLIYLILAAFFGFLASLTRYDGWFLVFIEAFLVLLPHLPKLYFQWGSGGAEGLKRMVNEIEGKLILFSTLSFFGIFLWLVWDFLILGDPLYFSHSEYSANSQQQNWLQKGELPTFGNLRLSVIYYFYTVLTNSGYFVFSISFLGLFIFLLLRRSSKSYLLLRLLSTPFIFNITTLYLGQSVIFIPPITPASFEWRLFNVRYGVTAIPTLAVLFGYLFSRVGTYSRMLLMTAFVFQMFLFFSGRVPIISLEDGLRGLSSAKHPDAQDWIRENYDGGMVLLDDYARTLSIIRSGLPMEMVIYVGNKTYWDESLEIPEKYARWIVMQKDDTVWRTIYENPAIQARLFKYFNKVYTSEEMLIFKKMET